MRAIMSLGLTVAAVALFAACGEDKDAASLPAAAVPEASGPMENVAEAGSLTADYVIGCGAPFTPDATPATLAAAFGRANVIPETIDGPEGETLNVTAIYPNDPERRIEVTFADEEARTGLLSVTVRDHTSLWKGQGGFTFGDAIDTVEAANGAPFTVSGFEWDYGGYVADWKGGKLADANGCRTIVRFAPESTNIPAGIVGDGVTPMSNDPAVREAQPKVSLFGISWAK